MRAINNNSLKGKIIYIDQDEMKLYYPDLHFNGFVPDDLGWGIFSLNKNSELVFKSIRPFLVYEETRTKYQCTQLWSGEFNWKIINNKKLKINEQLIDGIDYNEKYADGMCMLIKGNFLGNQPNHDSFINTSNYFQIEKDFLDYFVGTYDKCVKIPNPLNFNDHLDFLIKIYITSKKQYNLITIQTVDTNVLNENPIININENNKPSVKLKLGLIDYLTFEKVDKVYHDRPGDRKNISHIGIKENHFTFIANNWKINLEKFNKWQHNIKQSIYSLVYDEINKRTRLFEKENISDERKDEFITNWILDKNRIRNNNDLVLKIYRDVEMNKKENNRFLYNAFNNQINAYRENKLIGLDGRVLDSRKKIIVEKER